MDFDVGGNMRYAKKRRARKDFMKKEEEKVMEVLDEFILDNNEILEVSIH
jgi:hypothetical protein